MRRLMLSVLTALSPFPLAAQQNPFRPARPGIKGALVSYSLTGDIAGTATLALGPKGMARRQASTMKMMARSVSANVLPSLEKAYDNLDDAAEQRFVENAKDMASVVARGFGVGTMSEAGAKTGKKSYAGQGCEERQFGSFNICTMNRAPIALHSQGTMICMSFEETATSVGLSAPGSELFALPEGVTWTPNKHRQNADSMAIG